MQAAFRPAGGGFGAAQTISDSGQDARQPQVAVGAKGHALALWSRSDGTPFAFSPLRVSPAALSGVRRPSPPSGWTPPSPVSNPTLWAMRLPFGGNSTLRPMTPRCKPRSGSPEQVDGASTIVRAAACRAGGQFAPLETISEFSGDVAEPQLAVNRQGHATAICDNIDHGTFRIQASFRTRGRFGPPQFVSPAGDGSRELKLTIDEQSNSIAIWQRSDGTNLRIQTAFRPQGPTSSFGPPQSISAAGQDAARPQIALDEQGNGIAIWERSDGANNRVQAAFRPAGAQFFPAQTLSAGFAASSQLSVNAQGEALAAWVRTVGPTSVVQAAFRPAGGSFGPALDIFGAAFSSSGLQVAFDEPGNALAMWTNRGFGGNSNRSVQAAFRPAGGNFSTAQKVSDAVSAALAHFDLDAQGTAIALWGSSDGAFSHTSSRVQAALRPVGGRFGPLQPWCAWGLRTHAGRSR